MHQATPLTFISSVSLVPSVTPNLNVHSLYRFSAMSNAAFDSLSHSSASPVKVVPINLSLPQRSDPLPHLIISSSLEPFTAQYTILHAPFRPDIECHGLPIPLAI